MRSLFTIPVLAMLLAVPACAQEESAIDAALRDQAIEELAEAIDAEYFDEVRAAEIATMLREAHTAGSFDTAESPEEFAELVTAILREEDRHFAVQYFGQPEPEGEADTAQETNTSEDDTGLTPVQIRNYGFEEVSILPGNIGYIRFDEFAGAEGAAPTAIAALQFVAHTQAVIFDVRENRGGAPSMVQLLISHFLDPRDDVVINTFVSRDTDYPSELRNLRHLPAGARPDVPIYVLTSGNTGSAGEAFPYHLQAMERATIVGETTYGAGNPGDGFMLESGFGIFVSTGSARNPITQTNWEGVGVTPDVEVPADMALDQALLLAYEVLAADATDEHARTNLAWASELVEARLDPFIVSEDVLLEFVGSYGERQVTLEDGQLIYRRSARAPLALVPLSEDRFTFESRPEYRIRFERDSASNIVSISLHRVGSPVSTSIRDQ